MVNSKRGKRSVLKSRSRRSFVLASLQFVFLLVVVWRFYYLQIAKGHRYQLLSDRNRIRTKILPAIRGKILDRFHRLMAVDHTRYVIALFNCTDEKMEAIKIEAAKILSVADLSDKPRLVKVLHAIGYDNASHVIHDNLSWEDIAKIEDNIHRFPHLQIVNIPERIYAYGSTVGHITGYIMKGESLIGNMRGVSLGKAGLELSMQPILEGRKGSYQVEVDAIGRERRILNVVPPKQGQDIVVSLNLKLQRFIEEVVLSTAADWHGLVIVMEAFSGEILAMYSRPSYDPNMFIKGLEAAQWDQINSQGLLRNKAVSAMYPPGSVFKPVTALAIMANGLNPESTVLCTGSMRLGDRVLHCAKRDGHGYVNLSMALSESCNIYFAQKSLTIGINAISDMAKKLGLGQLTGIELPFEVRGLIPDKDWKKKRYGRVWNVGDTVNASIGQGYVLATPIQILLMLARISTGMLIKPTLFAGADVNNMTKQIDIPQSQLNLIRHAMHRRYRNIPGKIAGKTGTSQVISKRQSLSKSTQEHSLFMGFAPYDQPRYAILTIVDHGGWGRQAALPLALKILSELQNQD